MPTLPWWCILETQFPRPTATENSLPTPAMEGTDRTQMEQVSFIWTFNLFRELKGPYLPFPVSLPHFPPWGKDSRYNTMCLWSP